MNFCVFLQYSNINSKGIYHHHEIKIKKPLNAENEFIVQNQRAFPAV
jgi:hypothetical protein